jgi:hypothetical protein
MSEYLVVIKIPLEAMDDVEGRIKARALLKDIKIPEADIKLQRLVKGKAPVGIAV